MKADTICCYCLSKRMAIKKHYMLTTGRWGISSNIFQYLYSQLYIASVTKVQEQIKYHKCFVWVSNPSVNVQLQPCMHVSVLAQRKQCRVSSGDIVKCGGVMRVYTVIYTKNFTASCDVSMVYN